MGRKHPLVDSLMAPTFNSLKVAELRKRPSVKWQYFDEDVIPCWVADMDFTPSKAITDAMANYAAAGDLGYPPQNGLPGLREAVAERLGARHGLAVEPDQMQVLPGAIPGLYLASLTMAGPGEGVVVQPPVYPPFMSAVRDTGREIVWNPMVATDHGWRLDLEGLEEAITPATRVLALCNPQNPTGRVFERGELEQLARIVLRHRLWVVSDELHADLILEGKHVPFASLSPEIARRTVTLYGPTKAFNMAGLKISFAFSHNAALLERLASAGQGLVVPGNALAQAATLAAYASGDEWLDEALTYLRANRDFLVEFVRKELPRAKVWPTQGTYLAWLDLSGYDLQPSAAEYLLERARVGVSAGSMFGAGNSDLNGFVRLNFATSREILREVLTRIRDSLNEVRATASAGAAAG